MSTANSHLSDQNQIIDHDFKTTWIRYPFGVRLNSDPSQVLQSIIDVEQFMLEDDLDDKTLKEHLDILRDSSQSTIVDGVELNKHSITTDKEVNYYFNYPNFSDTRVGCNDVINPYWQFNRDDDICPPPLIPARYTAERFASTNNSRFIQETEHSSGMGRVYAETYDAQQQILWIEAGIPKFTNLIAYYRDAMDSTVAGAINNGDVTSIISDALIFIAKSLTFVITFGLVSIFYIARWTDRMVNERITKYYSFESSMTMYYAMVNSMLQYTAVSMGLHPLSLENRAGESIVKSLDSASPNNEPEKRTVEEVVIDDDGTSHVVSHEVPSNTSVDTNYDNYRGIPEVLRYGPDIFKIMNRRSRMIDLKNANYSTYDLMLAQVSKDSDLYLEDEMEIHSSATDAGESGTDKDAKISWSFSDATSNWWSALKGSVMGSGNHVGFKIERGLQPNESFSNSTGPTGLAEKFNSASQSAREDANESLFGRSRIGRTVSNFFEDAVNGQGIKQSFVSNLTKAAKETAMSTLASAVGFDIGTVLVNGNGFLEIPEIWKSSSAGARAYSVTFKLRSRYGDPVSIFQSIYIPLFLLIGLAAPRAIGDHSYTSPFMIRAYCRGMFHIPLGIVESLTIDRGQDEFGWNSNFLPLVVNVTMGIKDLSPQLFLSMNCGVIDTFTRNSTMQAYLDTLSGLGLRDMIYWWPKMVRKTRAALATARSTIFNSSYHGTRIGKSKIGKLISALVPFDNDRASMK